MDSVLIPGQIPFKSWLVEMKMERKLMVTLVGIILIVLILLLAGR